jgi:hypothetical protein
MDLMQLRASLIAETPPAGLSGALQALWYDAAGEWQTAHEVAQAQNDAAGAWVHAYLHRKEGDIPNARYWYRRAGKPQATISLDAEWEAIATALLARDT